MQSQASQQFRQFLQEYFEECKTKNSSFSLRAFANKIGLAPSTTSQLLSGKRNVSLSMAKKITEKLSLNTLEERKLLLPFVQGRPFSKNSARDLLQLNYNRLGEAEFEVISKWYFFAILSLMDLLEYQQLSTAQKIPLWMATKLDVAQTTIVSALKTLHLLGLIEGDIELGQKPQFTGRPLHSPDEVASEAVKKAHHDSFDLARRSLIRDDLETRDFNSLTIAVNPDKIPEAKKIIRKFLDEIDVLLGQGEKKEVYHLAIQMFPLTKCEPIMSSSMFRGDYEKAQ